MCATARPRLFTVSGLSSESRVSELWPAAVAGSCGWRLRLAASVRGVAEAGEGRFVIGAEGGLRGGSGQRRGVNDTAGAGEARWCGGASEVALRERLGQTKTQTAAL